jgi:hypothetical protein
MVWPLRLAGNQWPLIADHSTKNTMKLQPCYLPTLNWGAQYTGKTFINDLIAVVTATVIAARIFAKQSGVTVVGDET